MASATSIFSDPQVCPEIGVGGVAERCRGVKRSRLRSITSRYGIEWLPRAVLKERALGGVASEQDSVSGPWYGELQACRPTQDHKTNRAASRSVARPGFKGIRLDLGHAERHQETSSLVRFETFRSDQAPSEYHFTASSKALSSTARSAAIWQASTTRAVSD